MIVDGAEHSYQIAEKKWPLARKILLFSLAAFSVLMMIAGITSDAKAASVGYSLACSGGQINPGDTTDYYFCMPGMLISTTSTNRQLIAPISGTIQHASVLFGNNGGTQGSSETFTCAVRVNDSSYANITTAATINVASGSSTKFYGTGLGLAVSAGDLINIHCKTPNWATNPTMVVAGGSIFIETDDVVELPADDTGILTNDGAGALSWETDANWTPPTDEIGYLYDDGDGNFSWEATLPPAGEIKINYNMAQDVAQLAPLLLLGLFFIIVMKK